MDNNMGVQEYIAIYREKIRGRATFSGGKMLRIALLSSSTFNGVKEVLSVKCWEEQIESDIYVAPYSQYAQEILASSSNLYSFNPNFVFLSIDLQSVSGDMFFDPYVQDAGGRRSWVSAQLGQFVALIKAFRSFSSAMLVVHGMEVPGYSPVGILESKEVFGFVAAIRALNAEVENFCRTLTGVYFFDYDLFVSQMGKMHAFDSRFYYLGDMKLGMSAIPLLCDAYLAFIRPAVSKFRKCIVLDCDNTLWGGIIGEDGVGGIHLGPTTEGRPYFEFQKGLQALFRRGIILAVNSRNDMKDVLQVLREHPFMVLNQSHFAAMEVNWEDKASNLVRIATALNIGLDAIIYIDDDPMNCELVRSSLPAVDVKQVPVDSAGLQDLLHGLEGLDLLQLTNEDKDKGRIFLEDTRRREFLSSPGSVNEFIQQLGIEITVRAVDEHAFPRISQLTQKTNQFNLTTHRRQENELRLMSDGKGWLIEGVWVRDKFGDNGLVGMIIICDHDERWFLDTFLLSCRVIGRKIEQAMLAWVIMRARSLGIKEVVGEYIPTAKNKLVGSFYKDAGFELLEERDNAQWWRYDVACDFPFPDSIKLTEG